MHPLAAELDRVCPMNDRKVIAELRAPEDFVDIRLKEERVAEAKCGPKAHRRIGWNIGLGSRSGTFFSRIREVQPVNLGGRNGRV